MAIKKKKKGQAENSQKLTQLPLTIRCLENLPVLAPISGFAE